MNGYVLVAGRGVDRKRELGRTDLGREFLALSRERTHAAAADDVCCIEIMTDTLPWILKPINPRPALVYGRIFGASLVPRAQSAEEMAWQSYIASGPSGVARMNGEYCAYIHDPQRDRVIATTDLFGTRALYYLELPGVVAISDSCAVLLALFQPAIDLNDEAIAAFLVPFSPHCSARGETFFRQIRLLRAGERLEVNLHTMQGVVVEEPLPESILAPAGVPARHVQAHFAEAFQQAVADRCTGSRVAVALSGGLDSTAIAVALAALRRQRPTLDARALTASFGKLHADDELQYARLTASALDLPHVSISREAECFDVPCASAVPWADRPMGLSADLALTRTLTRLGAPALIGLGADEVFAASRRRPGPGLSVTHRVQARLRRLLSRLIARPRAKPNTDSALAEDLQRLIATSQPAWIQRRWHAGLPVPGSFWSEQGATPPQWHEMLRGSGSQADIESLDRDGMVRLDPALPFMDARVLAICLSAPVGLQERADSRPEARKKLLREYLAGRVPSEIIRRKKTGAGHVAFAIGAQTSFESHASIARSGTRTLDYLDVEGLPVVRVDRPWSTMYPMLAGVSLYSWLTNITGVAQWIRCRQ